MAWTKAEILAALHAAGEETGRWWTMTAWRAARLRPYPEQVFAICGSWSRAWTEAGFPPPGRWMRRTSRRWTDAEIAEALRRAADGRPLSSTGYDRWQRSGGEGPCLTIVLRRFGPWRTAAATAGVATTRDVLDRSEIVEALATLWREIGRRPTRRDWSAWSDRRCSLPTVRKHLGLSMPALAAEALAAQPDLPTGAFRSKALRRLLNAPRELLMEREREIAERAARGESLRQIGEAVGLSHERIRQIAMRGGRRRGHHRGPHPRLTRDETLSLLRQHFKETGQIQTLQRWMTMGRRPSMSVVVRDFGTWRAAWEAALGADHPALGMLKPRGHHGRTA